MTVQHTPGTLPLAAHMEGVDDALSIRYNNRVYELQAGGADVIVLSLGEAFFDIPLHDFSKLPREAVFHYSHSRGLAQLRDRIAAYYESEYGVPVDPETEIIVTAGSKIAIHMSLMTILDPGDEVLIHEPAWVSYTEQVKLCHARPVSVPWDVEPSEIESFLTPRTKIVILNYPNNPRGRLLTAEEWAQLHEMAERRGVFLLADEAYSDFVDPGEQFVSGGVNDPAKRHTIVCNSMSKNFGISGWRHGYVIGSPALIDQILKVNQHLVTCPATILSYYLAEHFHDLLEVTKPQIRDLLDRRRVVLEHMDAIGLARLPGTATFYVFASIADSVLGSLEFCDRLLEERHVAVVPGIGYGDSCDGFVRISVGTEPIERTVAGLESIRALIDETR
jgi:aspartate aminotransferase/aminotransferase